MAESVYIIPVQRVAGGGYAALLVDEVAKQSWGQTTTLGVIGSTMLEQDKAHPLACAARGLAECTANKFPAGEMARVATGSGMAGQVVRMRIAANAPIYVHTMEGTVANTGTAYGPVSIPKSNGRMVTGTKWVPVASLLEAAWRVLHMHKYHQPIPLIVTKQLSIASRLCAPSEKRPSPCHDRADPKRTRPAATPPAALPADEMTAAPHTTPQTTPPTPEGPPPTLRNTYNEPFHKRAIEDAIEYLEKGCSRRAANTSFFTELPSLADTQRANLKRILRTTCSLAFLRKLRNAIRDLPVSADGYCYLKIEYSKSRKYQGLGRRYAHGKYRLEFRECVSNVDRMRHLLDDPEHEKHPRNLCYQAMQRELRPVLCGGQLRDFDFVNSIPRVAHTFATELNVLGECTALTEYVNQRPEKLELVIEHYSVVREVAKDLFIRILHGGSVKAWRKHNRISFANVPRDLPFVTSFHSQIEHLRDVVLDHERRIDSPYGRKIDALLSAGHRKLSVFAVILQNREDACLETAARVVTTFGFEVCSLQYDGFLVFDKPPTGGKRLPENAMEDALAAVPAAILDANGVVMQMAEKPLYGTDMKKAIEALDK